MEIIIKGCTKEKDTREELLTAIERYTHSDMSSIQEYASQNKSRLLILRPYEMVVTAVCAELAMECEIHNCKEL